MTQDTPVYDLVVVKVLMAYPPARCECLHEHGGECTVAAVAFMRFGCTDERGLVCSELVEYAGEMAASSALCDGCLRLTSDCWKVVPV